MCNNRALSLCVKYRRAMMYSRMKVTAIHLQRALRSKVITTNYVVGKCCGLTFTANTKITLIAPILNVVRMPIRTLECKWRNYVAVCLRRVLCIVLINETVYQRAAREMKFANDNRNISVSRNSGPSQLSN